LTDFGIEASDVDASEGAGLNGQGRSPHWEHIKYAKSRASSVARPLVADVHGQAEGGEDKNPWARGMHRHPQDAASQSASQCHAAWITTPLRSDLCDINRLLRRMVRVPDPV
jgi:hypothetical protein